MNFWDKVAVFNKWMKKQKDCGLITTCGICDSTRIQRLSSETVPVLNGSTYTAKYKCLDCKSEGSNTEVWSST
jgi:hypothetical protein